MITVEALRQFGANVQEGMTRCLNKEDFYLRMVNLTLDDKCFEKLSEAIASDDRKAAFEYAHALKGVTGNVALTPLFAELSEVTELLRAQKDADYPAYLARILTLRNALLSLREC